jgi:branched-chain amino acid transport system substrate-binding protein
LKDIKNDYSVGLSEYFIKTFKELGGEVVVETSYSQGDVDFKSQLTVIKGKNPDAIFVPGYYSDVALISRQVRETGVKAPLLGGDGWDSPKLREIGKEHVVGNYFSNHYSAENQSPEVQSFLKKYKEAYGDTPDALAALGYDSAKILADSMNRAKELTPAAIRDAIAETKDLAVVTGKITFDENRNPVKSAVVLKVTDQGFAYQTTIAP